LSAHGGLDEPLHIERANVVRGVSGLVISTLLVACLILASDPAYSAEEFNPLHTADTSSPRDTLRSFIDATNEVYELVRRKKYLDRSDPAFSAVAERILDCIDTSELPAFARQERAGEVAACIKEILDRVELPPWEKIPGKQEIEAAGGFEKLSRWRIPGTRLTIARVEQGPQKHEYLFSPGTVTRAVGYFHSVESTPYRTRGPAVSKDLYQWFISAPGHPVMAAVVARLPERMRHGRTFGMANWKWPGVLLALLVTIALMMASYRLQHRATDRTRNKNVFRYCLTIVFPIVAMLIPLAFKYVAQKYFTVRGNPLYYISFLANLAAMLAAIVVIFAGSRRVAEAIIASPRINPRGLNAQLIRITSQLTSVVLTVALFLGWGQYLGIPIGTLLASAGIGGVAIALGAQDTLKTLFGTMMLMADKPFRVGERIQIGSYVGVVEDIGLRSTKIRLLTGHLVTIPNNQLAGSDIENIGRRPYIRRGAEIHIPLDTSCEKLERAVAVVRDKLQNHEGMSPDYPPRIFFDEFGSRAFCIRFSYWYMPPDHRQFKAFGDKLNFEIFRAFEQRGIQFSLPFRHSYWKHDEEQGPLPLEMVSDNSDSLRRADPPSS